MRDPTITIEIDLGNGTVKRCTRYIGCTLEALEPIHKSDMLMFGTPPEAMRIIRRGRKELMRFASDAAAKVMRECVAEYDTLNGYIEAEDKAQEATE